LENKKINFLTQYFYPDISSTGQLLTELAIDLVNQGFDVNVYTGQPNYGSTDTVEKEEIYKGIKIKRISQTRFDKNTKFGKIINSITFFISAFFNVLFKSNTPLLIVSNPPFLPLIGYLLKKIRSQKYTFLVHDIYPDIAVKLSYLKEESFIVKLWDWINKKIYNSADQIIVLGREMKNIIESKISNKNGNLEVISNWTDGDQIKPISKNNNYFVKENNLVDKFVILYSGNHGLFHDLETIIKAAKELKEIDDILFLFIGEGGKKQKLIKMVDKFNLKNVKFLPYQKKEELPYSLTSGDISLVSLEEGVEGLAVPCKLYSALAVGKPIINIMSKKAEPALVVGEYNCGYTVEPGNVNQLVKYIETIYNDKNLFHQLSKNARCCFENNFTRKIITKKYAKLLNQLY
jgi:glycosyltransferase involved in cell wall biosynthesis